jgi:predicted RNA-binding protein with PUA-like domain
VLKTDPAEYSFQQLVATQRRIPWDQVREPRSLTLMKGIRQGDRAFIYQDRTFVGTVRIASNPYPDISNDDPRYLVVDVEQPVALPHPVALTRVRHDLQETDLVRHPHLTVVSVSSEQFALILAAAQVPAPLH